MVGPASSGVMPVVARGRWRVPLPVVVSHLRLTTVSGFRKRSNRSKLRLIG